MKLNQGNWRATKTAMGTEDHQLRAAVVSILRKVLSLNHKILILLIMIQTMNSNLLGLKSLMVTNQTKSLVFTTGTLKKKSSIIFLENLKTTLHSLRNNNKISSVAGGFNYDILKYEHNPVINEFLDLMYSFSQPCILEQKRVVLNSQPNLIDNIYINIYGNTTHSGNFLDKVTDHMPNFCIIEDTYKVKKIRKIRIRDMQRFVKDKFLKNLEELKNLNLLQYKYCNMYNKFHEKCLQISDKNTPYKILSKKKQNSSKNLGYLRQH